MPKPNQIAKPGSIIPLSKPQNITAGVSLTQMQGSMSWKNVTFKPNGILQVSWGQMDINKGSITKIIKGG